MPPWAMRCWTVLRKGGPITRGRWRPGARWQAHFRADGDAAGPCLVYILWDAPDEAMHLRAQEALTAANIDSRRWYETGLHRMPHFADGQSLPVTERLARDFWPADGA